MRGRRTAAARQAVLIPIAGLVIWLGAVGAVLYVAIHFISKFW